MKSLGMVCGLLALSLATGGALAQSAEEERKAAEAEREAMSAELEAAQEQLREAAKRVAELHREMGKRAGDAFVWEFMSDEDRGLIGVVLDRDGEDLKIASVTPGSPADEAGVEAGDVVVGINGEPVVMEGDENMLEIPEGLRGLKVGEEVKLTLSGDSGTREVNVTAERRDIMSWAPAIGDLQRLRIHAPAMAGIARLDGDVRHKMRDAMKMVHVKFGRGWHRVELAPLNKDLGGYFGTEEGVLVVSAPEENPLGLKGGDVIKRIGDREPNDPGHAFRIVRSYGVGETLEVEILRNGERRTLTHEIQDDEDLDLGWAPAPASGAFAWATAPTVAEAPGFGFAPGDSQNWEYELETEPETAE